MVTQPDRVAVARVAAPVAFLVAATVAVVLVRAGLDAGQAPPAPAPEAAASSGAAVVTVRAGDTLAAIAEREGSTVAVIERLNPGIDPVSLTVGMRLRVR